jgi:hypothetical protein
LAVATKKLITSRMILPVHCSRLELWRGKPTGRAVLMDKYIAKANIEHFKKLIEAETDEQKRRVLEHLLAEEELKLAAAIKRRSDRKET